jgi:signal transduction histidine kinase
LCLYRVTQECLNNVAKHSGARKVMVAIRGNKDGILLSVTDDGKGFDPGLVADQSGLGLVGIRERVRLVDGIVSIDSRPGHGTQIDVRVPLPKRMDP